MIMFSKNCDCLRFVTFGLAEGKNSENSVYNKIANVKSDCTVLCLGGEQ